MEPQKLCGRTQRGEPAVPPRSAAGAELDLPPAARPAEAGRRLRRVAHRQELEPVQSLGVLAARPKDARPVRRIRVRRLLLAGAARGPALSEQPPGARGDGDLFAAGTHRSCQCRICGGCSADRSHTGLSPFAGNTLIYKVYVSMQRILGLLVVAGLVQGIAHAQTRDLATKGELLDRVAAVVNDGVVLASELDEQIAAISERMRTQKLELPPQNVLRQQVLERLVLEQIQLQRADKAGMKIPDEALNNALQEVAQQNHIELGKLPEALAAQGIDYPSYRISMRKELTLSLLRQRDVLQRISVRPPETDR